MLHANALTEISGMLGLSGFLASYLVIRDVRLRLGASSKLLEAHLVERSAGGL